jgi:hypothetical protein
MCFEAVFWWPLASGEDCAAPPTLCTSVLVFQYLCCENSSVLTGILMRVTVCGSMSHCATDRFEEVTSDFLMMAHLQCVETCSRLITVWRAYIFVACEVILWTKSGENEFRKGNGSVSHRKGCWISQLLFPLPASWSISVADIALWMLHQWLCLPTAGRHDNWFVTWQSVRSLDSRGFGFGSRYGLRCFSAQSQPSLMLNGYRSLLSRG